MAKDNYFFAVDGEGDISFFASNQGARLSAESSLDDERSNAEEGWSEGVTGIVWGRVLGYASETLRRPREESDVAVSPACDEIVDYEIKDVAIAGVSAFDVLTDAIGCVRDRRTIAREQSDSKMEIHLDRVLSGLRELRGTCSN